MRPVSDEMDVGSAPMSSQSPEMCFWEHLGATRAEEYAREDILGLCPQPVAAPPEPPAQVDHPDTLPRGTQADVPAAYSTQGAAPARSDPGAQALARWAQVSAVPASPTRKPASAAQTRRARLSYRLQRIWLTPFYRGLITRGLPVVLGVGVLVLVLSNVQNRAQIALWAQTIYSTVVDRPEFMVTTVRISNVAPELDRSVRARLLDVLPQSSFRLDLPALRAEIERYDSVAEASLRLGADGVLIVNIRERAPVVVWHSGSARQLLDIDGHRVAILADGAPMPDLPLIAGEGAPDHVREALALMDAVQPLGARMRGLVRVGARRWDVVLDRDQRIRLPERGAMQALERTLALDDAQDLLARDVLAVDLRTPTRPFLHVSPGALETLRAIRLNPSEASQ